MEPISATIIGIAITGYLGYQIYSYKTLKNKMKKEIGLTHYIMKKNTDKPTYDKMIIELKEKLDDLKKDKRITDDKK